MRENEFPELEALVASLGNVVDACARLGVSHSWYYKMARKAIGGQGGRPVQRRRHPQEVPEKVLARILELALDYPDWGCNRISHYLKLNHQTVSSTTVQKILRQRGLRTVAERTRAAMARDAAGGRAPGP